MLSSIRKGRARLAGKPRGRYDISSRSREPPCGWRLTSKSIRHLSARPDTPCSDRTSNTLRLRSANSQVHSTDGIHSKGTPKYSLTTSPACNGAEVCPSTLQEESTMAGQFAAVLIRANASSGSVSLSITSVVKVVSDDPSPTARLAKSLSSAWKLLLHHVDLTLFGCDQEK